MQHLNYFNKNSASKQQARNAISENALFSAKNGHKNRSDGLLFLANFKRLPPQNYRVDEIKRTICVCSKIKKPLEK